MADPAPSRQQTGAQPASSGEARARLAPLDDALLLLLAKRLARALLLDSDDRIGPDFRKASSGQL